MPTPPTALTAGCCITPPPPLPPAPPAPAPFLSPAVATLISDVPISTVAACMPVATPLATAAPAAVACFDLAILPGGWTGGWTKGQGGLCDGGAIVLRCRRGGQASKLEQPASTLPILPASTPPFPALTPPPPSTPPPPPPVCVSGSLVAQRRVDLGGLVGGLGRVLLVHFGGGVRGGRDGGAGLLDHGLRVLGALAEDLVDLGRGGGSGTGEAVQCWMEGSGSSSRPTQRERASERGSRRGASEASPRLQGEHAQQLYNGHHNNIQSL